MITTSTRIKTVAFVVISVLVIAYIGVRYADLGRYFGFPGYYVVTVKLGDTGGLFANSEVSYRGVQVGRVGAMELKPSGAVAELDIDDSAPPIPANSVAVVANRSAVGEQYLDLRPRAKGGPLLEAGDTIEKQDTKLPPPVTSLLTSLNGFVSSVPKQSLRTVVDELDYAFAGQGQNLQVLLDTGSDLAQAATRDMPRTKLLIDHGRTVLDTQDAETDALLSFAHDSELLADQLDTSDHDLRRLITAAPKAARQVVSLLRENTPSLSVMLANLLTLSDIAAPRQAGLEEALVSAPAAIAAGSTAINSDGANFGMALTFFNPLPCTAGYGETTYRNGLDTSQGPAWNTGARCTMPPGSGVNVRGSANAPHPGTPSAAKPGALRGFTADAADAGLPGALNLPPLSDVTHDMRGLLGLEKAGGR